MFTSLLPRLNADTVVITATQRLSMLLNQYYLNAQQISGPWQPATIMALQSWLEQFWQELCAQLFMCPPHILTEHQQQLLWENIIHHESSAGLLRTGQTATLAIQAWQLLKRWEAPLTSDFDNAEDTAAFKRWATAYEQLCRHRHWLTPVTLVDALLELLLRLTTPLKTKTLLLIGFIELPPQQQRLFKRLTELGFHIEFIKPSPSLNPQQTICCASFEQELATAARWIKQVINEAENPLIGCIIPNLSEHRDQVEAAFTTILCPEYLLEPQLEQLPVNIGANITLSQYPLIHSALNCLRLLAAAIPLEVLNSVLRSPFFAAADTEQTARALFSSELSALGERQLELSDVQRLIKRFNHDYHGQASITVLKHCCDKLARLQHTFQQRHTAPEWCAFFKQALVIFGWPGTKTLTSAEHQTKERWEEALREFAQLQIIMPLLTFSQAFERLQQLVQGILFQPKTATAAPIYILQPNDAIGFPFTHLWVMSMNDQQWPPAPKPNPFLPFRLQSQLGMPHATAEQELNYHQQLLTHLTAAADKVMLSYALHHQEEELRPSALVDTTQAFTVADLTLTPESSLIETIFNSQRLEHLFDEQGPAINHTHTIKGGISIFKHQAACPFKAFAKHRLGASGIASPQTGLSASERGNLIHTAMEYLWKRLGSYQTLCRYTDQQLQKLVQRAAQKAVLELKAHRPRLLKERFVAIEIRRLSIIIQRWLNMEKQRAAFDVIATEQQQEYEFADIPLKIRIDRIDQLADGSHLIIDYKTGSCSESAWFGERPDDPQLPFYCITSDLPISGLLFAQISSRETRFKGIVNLESQPLAPFNLKPIADWHEQVELWKLSLQHLAQQFRQGHAKVDPKEAPKTCQFCDLTLLCRVNDN